MFWLAWVYAVAFFIRVVVLADAGMTLLVVDPLIRFAVLRDAFIMAARSFECSIDEANLALVPADCLLLLKMLSWC